MKTISILGVHLASPSPNKWGIVFATKQKAQNIFERSQKKVQNKKQNLLQLSEHKECGFRRHQYEQALNSGTHNSCFALTWMQWHSYQQALNLHGQIYLLRQLCYGTCLNKQWICPGTFACCYLLHGISINKQWICISKFAC